MAETPDLSDEIERRIRAGWMSFKRFKRKLRPPEGKSAASEGLDSEVRGSRGSLIRMRDMDPHEGPLHQARYNAS